MTRTVILESPYAGDVPRNEAYARACLRDSLMRGEAPIASHLLYTQAGVLDDNDPVERLMGIDAGHAWLYHAEAMVVYTDLGVSAGMALAIERATAAGVPVERRRLPEGAVIMLPGTVERIDVAITFDSQAPGGLDLLGVMVAREADYQMHLRAAEVHDYLPSTRRAYANSFKWGE